MDECVANPLYEMNNPKVIVLLPVYRKDSPAYLQLSVDSMLAQTYEPLHILIRAFPLRFPFFKEVHQYDLSVLRSK